MITNCIMHTQCLRTKPRPCTSCARRSAGCPKTVGCPAHLAGVAGNEELVALRAGAVGGREAQESDMAARARRHGGQTRLPCALASALTQCVSCVLLAAGKDHEAAIPNTLVLTSMLAQFMCGSAASAPHTEQGAAASSGASSSLSAIRIGIGQGLCFERQGRWLPSWPPQSTPRLGVFFLSFWSAHTTGRLAVTEVPKAACSEATYHPVVNKPQAAGRPYKPRSSAHATEPLTGADGHTAVEHKQRACRGVWVAAKRAQVWAAGREGVRPLAPPKGLECK